MKSLNPARFAIAKSSLQDFLGLSDFKGKTFLDIGCGSGLFSYAAYELGATKVVSIDVDPFSVKCTEYLKQKAGNPGNWQVLHASILDQKFLAGLGKYDIAYAWGSLHHTGDMWQAIKNSANLVADGGMFQLAIYNKANGRWGSNFWLKMKKFYNQSPVFLRKILEYSYMAKLMAYFISRGRNPAKIIRDFKNKRGMSWKHDIIDWLGGYPYEFATAEEISSFMKKNFAEFSLANTKTTDGLGNNQFVFKKAR